MILPHIRDENARDALFARMREVSSETFDTLALDIFDYQFKGNDLYRSFCTMLSKSPDNVKSMADIPFLPVGFFKSRDIRTNAWPPQIVFESSGTSGQIPARHAIRDLSFYLANTARGFHSVFKRPVGDFCWLGLLPSYQERRNASLVHMVSHFIDQGQVGSAFVSPDDPGILGHIAEAGQCHTAVALIGVSFALLDLTDLQPVSLSHTMIIETGGMKGRRAEITRRELHDILGRHFDVESICSEYGMTELQSQAWSRGDGVFVCSPTLRVIIRDITDPLSPLPPGERGAINCIDLANIDTCAFIATDDIGTLLADGSFTVDGRLDGSELRGCNLMM